MCLDIVYRTPQHGVPSWQPLIQAAFLRLFSRANQNLACITSYILGRPSATPSTDTLTTGGLEAYLRWGEARSLKPGA
jgi:hypothetical protein